MRTYILAASATIMSLISFTATAKVTKTAICPFINRSFHISSLDCPIYGGGIVRVVGGRPVLKLYEGNKLNIQIGK